MLLKFLCLLMLASCSTQTIKQEFAPKSYLDSVAKNNITFTGSGTKPTFKQLNLLVKEINYSYAKAEPIKQDVWREGSCDTKTYMDCGDYVLCLRYDLIHTYNIDTKYLHIATLDNNTHAALIINAVEDIYVYDMNQNNKIKPFHGFNYNKIQISKNYWVNGNISKDTFIDLIS